MASRKEQKEAARQRRLEEERQRAEQAARNRRFQMLGGMGIIVVAIIVVVFVVSSSSGSTGLQHGKTATATQTQVESLLAGIPQSGRTLGDPSAPVTITYFGDLECPICRAFTLGLEGAGFPQLIANEVKTGKVKVEYKSFCTATCNGPGQSVFTEQQSAAYAAGDQNKFWDFAELFYREQGTEDTDYVNQSYLNGLAEQVPGLDLTTWQSASGASSLKSAVSTDESAGTALGVTGTPTLFATGPKGKTAVPDSDGAPGATYSELQQAIAQVS
jgi:protein-disulfide isomerase